MLSSPKTTRFCDTASFIHSAIPVLLFATVVIALFVSMRESLIGSGSSVSQEISVSEEARKNVHFNFSTPTSYFLPSLESTNPAAFDPTTSNFGLIPRSYDSDESERKHEEEGLTDWQRFNRHLSILNTQAPDGTFYYVLFLARHGQGYHNLAEAFYGTLPWDCYWAELSGDPDSDIIWEDARLSKLGQSQAREHSKFWAKQLDEEKMPAPKRWYVSPMDRACKTLEITFEPLAKAGKVQGWKPIVKELLRETNGIHTCDRRSPRSVITSRYPEYVIEDGFTEQDELWDPVYREADDAHTYRAALLLDDILSNLPGKEHESFISFTVHGGMINAILRAIGHRQFQVKVGSAIAVLLKAERQNGKREHRDFARGGTKPECTSDPLKAGLPGYKNFKDYVDKIEASVGTN